MASPVPPGIAPEIGEYVEAAFTSAGADINAGFVLGSAYLVFFMHCGFAMVSLLTVNCIVFALRVVEELGTQKLSQALLGGECALANLLTTCSSRSAACGRASPSTSPF